MATSVAVQGAETDFARPPKPYLLLAIALAGCAARLHLRLFPL